MREKKPILTRVKEVTLFKTLAPPLVAAFLVLSPICTTPREFASLLSPIRPLLFYSNCITTNMQRPPSCSIQQLFEINPFLFVGINAETIQKII